MLSTFLEILKDLFILLNIVLDSIHDLLNFAEIFLLLKDAGFDFLNSISVFKIEVVKSIYLICVDEGNQTILYNVEIEF